MATLAQKIGKRTSFRLDLLAIFMAAAIAITLSMAVLNQTAFAATGTNKTINFQGKVTNNDGTNVADNDYSFTFKIYSVSTAGTAIWTETKTLTVTDGIFQTALGDSTTLPGSVDFNTDNIYLGIEFNGDGEMAPRVRFASVPQALNALKVAGLTVTDTTGTFTLTDAKTLTVQNSLTLAGTDSKTLTLNGSTTLADNAITFGGTQTLTLAAAKNVTFADAFTTSGANSLTLTTTSTTDVTLPTTGTLATLAGSETLTNKSLTDNLNAFTANGDASKLLKFDVANVGAGTTLTLAVPASPGTADTICLQTKANCAGGSGSSVWSDLTAPSASLSLAFDDGEVNTFASSSDTETFWTATGNSLTSGKLYSLTSSASGLTTGSLLNTSYTGTAGFTGGLNIFDYSPASTPSTAPTGDLLRLNLGANASNFSGNFLNILDNGSSVLGVSKTAFTTSLPANFTAAGDVAIAYDINFTNPTASYIKSTAPLYITAGEVFNSSNLTLQTYNNGTINFNAGGFDVALIGYNSTGAYPYLNLSGKTTTGDPAACTVGDIYFNTTDAAFSGCTAANTWTAFSGGGGGAGSLKEAYDGDTDGSNAVILMTSTDGSIVMQDVAGTQFQVTMASSTAPTVDMVSVLNTGTSQGTSTTGVDGLQIDFATAGTTASADNAGLRINVTSNNSGSTTTLEGLYIGDLSSAEASSTETALRIGTGWDQGLLIESGNNDGTGLVYSGTGRPTKRITLSPEYAGAVITTYYGAGTDTDITGNMTSDTDTSQGSSIRNYYQWLRTTDATQHFYTVAVRVTLPKDFSAWAASNALTVAYKTQSATNTVSDLDVRVYNENDATIVASSTDNASTSWTTVSIDDSTLDDGASSEWDAADETAVIYLRMGSASSNYVRVGDITLNYLSKF